MRADTFTLQADDAARLFVYRWLPDEGMPLEGVVLIVHGMAEHAGRYARLAEALTAAGWATYGGDLRGHGRTAAGAEDLGLFALSGGFRRVVRDLEQTVAHVRQEHPGLPVVLLGHSMGSYVVQGYLMAGGGAGAGGGDVQGAALSGTSGKPSPLAGAARLIARLERRRLGPRGRSAVLDRLSFGAFNEAFRPNRTKFDWLTRDAAEVDRYLADPFCGFVVTTSLWIDVLDAMVDIARPEQQARLPKGLPVYVFTGSEDPVGERSKSVAQLVTALRAAGLGRVRQRIYSGGRHEMLNETNRDEVTRDLLAWLDAEVTGASARRAASGERRAASGERPGPR